MSRVKKPVKGFGVSKPKDLHQPKKPTTTPQPVPQANSGISIRRSRKLHEDRY